MQRRKLARKRTAEVGLVELLVRLERKRSTNDAPHSMVAQRVRCGNDAGQRRSAGIFQGSSAS
jgi:hypothetical protein